MKHLYRLALALVVVGFVEAAVFFMLAPDTVPAHYNAAGELTRMGSKYEYILLPMVTAAAVAIFLPLAKRAGRKKGKDSELEEMILAGTAVFEALLFDGMWGFFMWSAATYTEGTAMPAAPAIDIIRVISLVTGVLLIVLGNVMPKARKNAIFGIRTKWSMSSDEVWRKSQRFGGFASVLAGALLLANAMFLEGIANFLIFTFVAVLWSVVSIAASYRYYKAEKSA